MRRFRALAVGLGIVLGLAGPIASVPGTALAPPLACAADTGPRAVLVVDNGARVQQLCVALDGETVSGIHLVELAASQHGLSYALGFGKQAICQLDGVGPSGGDCFAEYPDFWGYWHGTGSGGWTWASGGAATFRVGDGDVEGWVWGSGDTGASHRAPPLTRVDDICPEPSPEPSPTRAPDPKEDDPPAGGGAQGSGPPDEPSTSPDPSSGGATDRRDEPRAKDTEGDDEEERYRSSSPSVSPSTDASSDDGDDLRATGTSIPEDGADPPLALLAAILLGGGLAAAAWWRSRRSAGGGAT